VLLQANAQHAIAILRIRLVRLHVSRQLDAAAEGAAAPIGAVIPVTLLLMLFLFFTGEGEYVSSNRDVDILGIDSWNFRSDGYRLVVLRHVHGRAPAGRHQRPPALVGKEPAEKTVQLGMEILKWSRATPASQVSTVRTPIFSFFMS